MQNADGSVIIKLYLDYNQFEKDAEKNKRTISESGKEMEKSLQQAQKQYDQSSKKAGEFQRALNKLDAEVDRLQDSLIEERGFKTFIDAGLMTEDQLESLTQELFTSNTELQKLTASAEKAQENLDLYTEQMRGAEKIIQDFKSNTDDAAQSIDDLGDNAESAKNRPKMWATKSKRPEKRLQLRKKG